MKKVFPIIDNRYDLRNKIKFKSRRVHTVRYGIETASFVLPRIWSSIPRRYKNVVLLTNLRQKLSFGIQKTAHANFAKITSIKQVIHRTGFLIHLLSVRASFKTTKWNSVCLEIPFGRTLSLMETS